MYNKDTLGIYTFANKKEITESWLRSFLLKEGYLKLSKMFIKFDENEYIYFSEFDKHLEYEHLSKVCNIVSIRKDKQTLFNSKHMNYILDLQNYIKDLLENQLQKAPIMSLINDIYYRGEMSNSIVTIINEESLSTKPLNFLVDTTYATLKEFMDIHWLFLPIMHNDPSFKLDQINRCAECGDYYQYVQKRSNYCSPKCLMKATNRKRRSK